MSQIFLTGIVLGTHLFGAPTTADPSSTHLNAQVSPLAAATAHKDSAAADIQKLILESAKAEAIEKSEHEQEIEALKHGDVKKALHLRGMLAPGDKNYNPHHAVDDILAEEGFEGDAEEGGDGAMYAGDTGDHQQREEEEVQEKVELSEKEDMHNHFAEAVKQHLETEKKSLGEKLHDLKVGASEIVKHGLRGGDNKEKEVKTEFDKEESTHYPYMTVPVSEDYDFTKYEPLGGGRFAEYKDGDSPYAITDKLREQSDELARSRRVHVLNGMKHIWKNYKEKAFGADELHPVSGTTSQNWGGMGTT